MLRIDQLSVMAGSFTLANVGLEISGGKYAILMGITGSGKTTLLESICGLRPATAGAIWLDHKNVIDLPPRARGIGYVPQDLALFTTMTVRENIGFALELRGMKESDIRRRVDDLATILGVQALLERMPMNLSGGEKQRVALGRALAAQPSMLLLDEPFSALDDNTKDEMYTLMRTVRAATGATVLHVTHSRAEAQALGDLIFVLDQGRITERNAAIREEK
jgi:molybdate/tungstate transport system ATP-binding protein